MTPIQYAREIIHTLSDISQQTNYSFLQLALAFTRCFLTRHTQIEEFQTLRLYDRSNLQLSHYLTYYQSCRFSDRLNAAATKEDIAIFNDKHLFNTTFHSFIHRHWLYLPDSTPEQIRSFIECNETFLVKACVSTQGKNIFKFDNKTVSITDFLAEYQNKPYILEAYIHQHPVLSAVNSSSVNTVRFVAAKKGNRVQFIGAGLRCGGNDQFVDNFHHGGAAYPIDMETGIITGPGITLKGNNIIRHPTTGHIMPGLQIPHWDMVLNTVRSAALCIPHIGYVGWDLAITEDGVELIEGNVNYPGTTTIQLDGPGARQRLLEIM